jgi:hypothetical protein
MNKHPFLSLPAIFLGAIFVQSQPYAGIIVQFKGASGPGLGTANVLQNPIQTPAPSNDDKNPSQNSIAIQKRFDKLDYIDMVFVVTNANVFDATEYYINDDAVLNNTKITWLDFHFELGFGTGVNFSKSTLEDELDFDTPNRTPKPTSDVFTKLVHSVDTIDWFSPAMVPHGDTVKFTLSIDVPDTNLIPMSARTPNGYEFTLRERPTVPEIDVTSGTGAFTLLASTLGLLAERRRRSQADGTEAG